MLPKRRWRRKERSLGVEEGVKSDWGRVEEGGVANGRVGVEEGAGSKHVLVEEGGGGNGRGNGKWCR